MSWSDLGAAIALFLVIEGLMPFLSPPNWRRSLGMIARLSDGPVRFVGLGSIIAGLVLLLLIRG